ncbi:MAG TPA: FlgD immunoglobulin-like domain containing protein, partial [Rectinemataceae bacterium]|nr:FlgD immunoglobulin-like domain containing protein [Rectinemataceae bacterium]
SNTVSVSRDTEKKAVRLLADLKAFSSLVGADRNRLGLEAQVQGNDKVKSYELAISALDVPGLAAGSVVRTWKDSRGVPASFSWDGSNDAKGKAPDGRYTAKLSVSYLNGDSAEAQAGPFLLDSVPPSIKVSAAPLLFSPTEGSRKRSVQFSQSSVPGDDWEGRLSSTDGTVVRTWTWKGQASDFVWDGTDEAGNLVKDGGYRYDVASTDAAGNKGTGSVPYLTVDKRPTQVFVTASATGLSPTGAPEMRSVVFTLIVKLREGIDSWHFALVDKDGVERSVYGGQGGDIPSKIVWDGRDTAGNFTQGEYTGVFTVDYAKGDQPEARTGKILVNTEGPKAEVKISPDVFSPDDYSSNNELHIGLSVKDASDIADWKFEVFEQAVVEGAAPGAAPVLRSFMSWSGTGTPTPLITWDGRSSKGELVESATDYPFTFTANDVLGNSVRVDGTITVDILVIREGDKLKIKVPSIVFRANFPDFVGLDQDTLARNAKVVARIAASLNKFKDYSVQIEGFANSIAKITGASPAAVAAEEQKELIPLSLGRAELVKKLLVQNGVDEKRLTTAGLGSSSPVVDFQDAQNRWKNRRVEFILIKKQ